MADTRDDPESGAQSTQNPAPWGRVLGTAAPQPHPTPCWPCPGSRHRLLGAWPPVECLSASQPSRHRQPRPSWACEGCARGWAEYRRVEPSSLAGGPIWPGLSICWFQDAYCLRGHPGGVCEEDVGGSPTRWAGTDKWVIHRGVGVHRPGLGCRGLGRVSGCISRPACPSLYLLVFFKSSHYSGLLWAQTEINPARQPSQEPESDASKAGRGPCAEALGRSGPHMPHGHSATTHPCAHMRAPAQVCPPRHPPTCPCRHTAPHTHTLCTLGSVLLKAPSSQWGGRGAGA